MSTLKIFCGESVDEPIKLLSIESGFHPIAQFKKAKNDIKILLENDNVNKNVTSNSPDYVSALYYLAEKYGITCEIYLNGKLSTIDDVFTDFNRFYDLLDEELNK